jgi:hypothetical protein
LTDHGFSWKYGTSDSNRAQELIQHTLRLRRSSGEDAPVCDHFTA